VAQGQRRPREPRPVEGKAAIESCRTAALGGHVARCEDCAHEVIAYNSCRNRHCPKCQGAAARGWLAEREAELLPTPYYHVVFTLPAAIGDIAYQNKAGVGGDHRSAKLELQPAVEIESLKQYNRHSKDQHDALTCGARTAIQLT